MSDERWRFARAGAKAEKGQAGVSQNRESTRSYSLSYCMLYKLGRFLQFLGLLILPIPMAGNMAGHLTVGQMLTGAGVGIAVFFAGWLLQQATRPR
jgi:hypothetical protein